MKHIYLLLVFFACSQCFSQTNLEFNKVNTFTGTLNFTSNNSTVWTVPENKAWKIESMTTNQQFIASSGTINMYFELNGVKIKLFNINGNANYPLMIENLTPLWLKAGDSIQFTSNTNNAGTFTCNYYLSILEFNLSQ